MRLTIFILILIIPACATKKVAQQEPINREETGLSCEAIKFYTPDSFSIDHNWFEEIKITDNYLITKLGVYVADSMNNITMLYNFRPDTLYREGNIYSTMGQIAFSPYKFKTGEKTYTKYSFDPRQYLQDTLLAICLIVYEPQGLDSSSRLKGAIYKRTKYVWYGIYVPDISGALSSLDANNITIEGYKLSYICEETIKFNPFFGIIPIENCESSASILKNYLIRSIHCANLRYQLEEEWFGK